MAIQKVTPRSNVQIPTPKMVAEYFAVSTAIGELMLSMIQRELNRNNTYANTGMWLAFASLVILVACAVWLALKGQTWTSIGLDGATAAGMITAFLSARR